jgi:PleD family two-component response regulator
MRRADQALYEAKRQGKNRLAVKSPPFIKDLLRRA